MYPLTSICVLDMFIHMTMVMLMMTVMMIMMVMILSIKENGVHILFGL